MEWNNKLWRRRGSPRERKKTIELEIDGWGNSKTVRINRDGEGREWTKAGMWGETQTKGHLLSIWKYTTIETFYNININEKYLHEVTK